MPLSYLAGPGPEPSSGRGRQRGSLPGPAHSGRLGSCSTAISRSPSPSPRRRSHRPAPARKLPAGASTTSKRPSYAVPQRAQAGGRGALLALPPAAEGSPQYPQETRPPGGSSRSEGFSPASQSWIFCKAIGTNPESRLLTADRAVLGSGLPKTALQLTSTGEGPSQGHLVGVLQIPADGEAAREGRHPDRQVLDLLRYKQGGRLPRRVRVGRDDELGGAFVADTLEELGYPQVLGFDPVQRRQGPAEDVVEASVLVGPFYRTYIVGVFHDADHRLVPTGVAADLTLLCLGQVEAATARFDLLLDLLQRLGEPYGVLFLAPDNVEGDALRAPRPDGG